MPSTRPIFLVGCPRSGTTLLSAILHAHPRIAMAPETRALLPAYYGRAGFGDLTVAANRWRLGRRITNPPSRFRDLGLDRRAVVRAVVDAPPTLGSALATVWAEYAASRGAARWGDKRPAYSYDLGVVLRLFPDAQIVHLLRDARSCVASLARAPFWKGTTAGATAVWTLAERELSRAQRRLPTDTFHLLRYEDLVRDPEPVLRELCEFLGERFEPGMLDHTGAAADIVPLRKSWHDNTRASIDPGRAGAWADALSPAELALVTYAARRQLRRNGYVVGTTDRPSPKAILEYRVEYARRLAAMRRRHALDRIQARHETADVASRL